ncbi:MAG: RloB domain-containing protein [Barnesiella sp.]|nr:RloB domain-containing protein [Barnesiella sp.]
MRERITRKKKRSHRTFLVICEGETERVYIEALKHQYRLPIAIRTKVSGNAINQRLVSQYLKELGLYDKDEYRIFYVYDCDIECIVDRLNKLEGTTILTNPCIELWFLLHLKEHSRACSSESIVKMLSAAHPSWKNYTKGKFSHEQHNQLMSNYQQAIQRADKLEKHANPSSDMPLFIRELDNEKNG